MNPYWLVLLPLFFFISCNHQQEKQLCYHAVKDDFTEKITVNGTIKAENTTFIKAPRLFGPTIIWVEENGKFVGKGDTVCILEEPQMQAAYENMSEEMEVMEAQLKKLESDHLVKMAMLQADIENNNIQLAINSLDSLQKTFAPPLQQKIISLQQEKAIIKKKKLEKNIAAQKSIGESEIKSLRFRIIQQKNRLQRIEDELDKLIITTPKAGVLILSENPELMFHSSTGAGKMGGKVEKGATTYTNMNIAEIPEMEKMQILAELSETHYKKAQEGQHVKIMVEAKDNLTTTGTILRKMLTGRKRGQESRVKFYEALIEVDSCHKALTPGMDAKCEIIISEYKDTLVVPVVSVFEDKDQKYVYVLQNKKYRKTIIETGNSGSTFAVIKSGLPEGAYIAFSKPPAGKIAGEKKPETDDRDSTATDTTNLLITRELKKQQNQSK